MPVLDDFISKREHLSFSINRTHSLFWGKDSDLDPRNPPVFARLWSWDYSVHCHIRIACDTIPPMEHTKERMNKEMTREDMNYLSVSPVCKLLELIIRHLHTQIPKGLKMWILKKDKERILVMSWQKIWIDKGALISVLYYVWYWECSISICLCKVCRHWNLLILSLASANHKIKHAIHFLLGKEGKSKIKLNN